MSETNETEGKTGGRKRTLNLRRNVESGHVRQSFSHGRSKSVLVEKKKRRSVGPGGAAAQSADEPGNASGRTPAKETAKPAASKQRRSGVVLKQLSEEEKDARAKALADARVREAEERERAKEDAAREAALAEQHAKEAAEAEARKREEEAKKAAQEDAEEDAEEAVEEKVEAKAGAKTKSAPKAEESARRPLEPEKEEQPKRQADARHKKGAAAPRRGDERRVRGRLTITNALDEEQRQRSLASLKRHRERQKKQGTGNQPGQKIAREVTIPDVITIQELANRMAERGVEIIKYLMKDGAMHKITDVIDADTAELIAEDFSHTVRRVSEADVEEGFIGKGQGRGSGSACCRS